MRFFIPNGGVQAGDIQEALREIAQQTETSLLTQLNEFISRGLLIVEHSEPLLVQHAELSNKIELRKTVKLKIKDQEYIESLERQVKELNGLVAKLRAKEFK